MARAALACAIVTISDAASAIQPLESFLESARTRAPENREAAAIQRQRSAELEQAWQRLLPAFTGQGRYRYNQYEVSFPVPLEGAGDATIGEAGNVLLVPKNEWSATLTLQAPLIDVGGWQRVSAARRVAESAHMQRRATGLEVEGEVARRYYQLLAARALVEAAERSLAAARENLRQMEVGKAAGTTHELDVQRARAEVERLVRNHTDAVGLEARTGQALVSISGLNPLPGWERPRGGDSLAPLARYLARMPSHPEARAADADVLAAEATRDAAIADFAPRLSAVGTEELTNATSFVGRNAVYAVGLNLDVTFDPSLIGAAKAQKHAVAASRARRDDVRQDIVDRVHDAWYRTRTEDAARRAARAEVEAAREALRLARIGFAAGTTPQLDLIQAERDEFRATASLIEAEANYALARAELRLASGLSLAGRRPATP